MMNTHLKLVILSAIFALSVLASACESLPAAKINPNGGDVDSETTETPSDGDSDFDSADSENDGNDNSKLPLDEALDAMHARAGEVTKPDSELLPGEKAQGEAGDFKIYNNRVAYIIQSGKHSKGWRGVSGSGGTVIDAAALDENGTASEDHLLELWPAVEMDAVEQGIEFGTYRNFKVETLELVNNGINGKAAVIKASGVDWGSPLADKHSQLLSSPLNPQIKLVIYYRLDPDSDYLRIEIEAKQESSDSALKEFITIGAGLLTDSRQETYYYGYRTENEPAYLEAYSAPELARFSNGSTHMLSCGKKENLQLMRFEERPYYATCTEMLKLENGATVSKELRFYVSAESPDALMKSIYYPENSIARVKGTLSIPQSLSKEEIIVAAKDFNSDRLISISYPHKSESKTLFEFFVLPEGKPFYIVAYSNAGGEGIPSSSINLSENSIIENLPAISPAAPAELLVSVRKPLGDGNMKIPARLDFYTQSNYNARKKPYFTAFIGDDQPERILLPMYGVESQTFTVVASAGLFHSIDIKTDLEIYAAQSENDIQTLEFDIIQAVDLGIASDTPQDGDIDEAEIEDEFGEDETESEDTTEEREEKALKSATDTVFVPLAAGLLSDASLDNSIPISESLKAARAAGYRAVSYADACTVTPADTAIEHHGYSEYLSAIPATRVKTPKLDEYSQSGYVTGAFGISAPDDAEQYFDIPGFYYSDYDGGFNGVSPPPGAWDALRFDYSAVLIHQPFLRGNGDKSGLLERFGKDGLNYDPYVGKDSLDSLLGDYLAQWNSISLLSAENDFIYLYRTLIDWASFLNQGFTSTATFGNDGATLSGMGYPVNLLLLNDNAWNGAATALTAALKKRRNIIVAGPTVKINIEDALPGDTYTPSGISENNASLQLHMQVKAPLWVPFNFVMLLQNGVVVWPPKNFNMAAAINTFEDKGYRVFEQDISIALPKNNTEETDGEETNADGYKDFWIAAMALSVPNVQEMTASAKGENLRESSASYTLFPVYPEAISFGLSNPIWVDANGNGEFEEPGVLTPNNPYLQSSELCAVIIAHDYKDLLGLRKSCCEEFPTATYCKK